MCRELDASRPVVIGHEIPIPHGYIDDDWFAYVLPPSMVIAKDAFMVASDPSRVDMNAIVQVDLWIRPDWPEEAKMTMFDWSSIDPKDREERCICEACALWRRAKAGEQLDYLKAFEPLIESPDDHALLFLYRALALYQAGYRLTLEGGGEYRMRSAS